MRFPKTSIIYLLAASSITACGGKDKKEKETPAAGNETPAAPAAGGSATKLEGAWEIKRAEGIAADANVGTVYEFSGNNLTMTGMGISNPGTTEVTDSTFTFENKDKSFKLTNTYRFSGDTLVASPEGSGQSFYMIKN